MLYFRSYGSKQTRYRIGRLERQRRPKLSRCVGPCMDTEAIPTVCRTLGACCIAKTRCRVVGSDLVNLRELSSSEALSKRFLSSILLRRAALQHVLHHVLVASLLFLLLGSCCGGSWCGCFRDFFGGWHININIHRRSCLRLDGSNGFGGSRRRLDCGCGRRFGHVA